MPDAHELRGTPGFGRSGFCSICASPNAIEYVAGARKGWNAKQFNEAAEANGESWNRQTWYSHLRHAKSGEQHLIQAAEKVRRQGALTVGDIKKSSNAQLLEAIRDIGMAKALANPDDVTIDQALKAVQIMEGRKEKGSDALNILIAFTTGAQLPTVIVERSQPEIIEGTAEEITP